MTPLHRKLLLAFAALGLGASLTSSYVHYRLLTDPSYSSFCDVNATVSCTQAYLSQYGSFRGIPVALAGVFFFVLVLLLAGAGGRPRSAAHESAPGYIFALSTIGLAFVLYLGWASYFQLKMFCMLCAVTYVAVIGLFIISGGATTVPMSTLPRRAARDLRALVSSPLALLIVLLFLAGAGSAMAWFPSEQPPSQQAAAAAAPLTAQQLADLEKWWDVQTRADIPVPTNGAKVLVVGFSDYQCPHCRAAHEAYKDLLAKYTATGKVHFVAKHFPLEGECNKFAAQGSHMAGCEAAAGVVLARATGKAAALDDWLYTNQATLTPSKAREAAHDIGGIADFNGGYAGALEEVKADANLGGLLGVNSTPTFFINGKKLPPGVMPAPWFEAILDMELKRVK
jgi:protein-disulfide isomerase/uncharacterized membrane protein